MRSDGGLEADESVMVDPERLLWEGQISHRWDGQGVVRVTWRVPA